MKALMAVLIGAVTGFGLVTQQGLVHVNRQLSHTVSCVLPEAATTTTTTKK